MKKRIIAFVLMIVLVFGTITVAYAATTTVSNDDGLQVQCALEVQWMWAVFGQDQAGAMTINQSSEYCSRCYVVMFAYDNNSAIKSASEVSFNTYVEAYLSANCNKVRAQGKLLDPDIWQSQLSTDWLTVQ